MSKPMLICSAGNDNASIISRLKSGQVHLQKNNDYGDKEFMLGAIKNLLPLPPNTPTHFKTRTNTILYNALLNGENLIKEVIKSTDSFAVVIGTTTTGIEENYNNIPKKQYLQSFSSLDNPALFVRSVYDICGLSFGVSSACTSGAKAIIEGARLINSGLCEAVICGGVDSLNTLTINGFDSLEILSAKPSRAFCADREGINIGEGAGVFVLMSSECLARNPHLADDFIIALKGYANNNDAFHITQPRTDFAMQERLLSEVLLCANLTPSDIDYINLHGTGTQANDAMESATFAYALNGALKSTPSSSIKPLIGHTLGAAGAIEAGVCAEMILQSIGSLDGQEVLIPHIYHNDFDKSLPQIALVKQGEKAKVRNALSVSFAFGGDNSAIILGQA